MSFNRRTVLRGMLGGTAVSVALPLFEAQAAGDLPPVFISWFQSLGLNPGRWKPSKVGAGYENAVELKVLDPYKSRVNVVSGMKYFMDGRPLETHTSGNYIATMGYLPMGGPGGATIDTTIGETIGARTRFRSLEISMGGGRQSWSKRAGGVTNPSDPSPASLYARLFGPDFKDPNAAEFVPETQAMARRSVLSAIGDERKGIMGRVGANDRARIDEYFTALRQIEQQLDLSLQKPTPLPACRVAAKVEESGPSPNVTVVEANAKLFNQLMAHAVACDQTRVLNVNFNSMGMHRPGAVREWHNLTHEEPLDPKLGYQPETTWFIEFGMARFTDFVRELDQYKEGSGSVLDRVLMLWQTDHGYARTHSMDDLPVLTVGSGGGRIKTGLHVSAPGEPTTRIGLTVQQALGVATNSWGKMSNQTSRPFTELLA
jgi:hypothetical protein